MIYGVFIVNNQGQGRLVKVYTAMVSPYLFSPSFRSSQYLIISNHSFTFIYICYYMRALIPTRLKDEKLQQLTLRQAYNIVSNRDDSLCNFLEVTTLTAFKEKGVKIVYRTYATLHIIFIVDSCESVLGVLDLIQVFVETLDTSFSNVCELDLQFHLDKVS